MIEAAAEAIPLTVEVKVFTTDVKRFEVTAVVVAATPLTVVVIVLPEVVAELVVDDATMPASDVVEVTPLTFETRFVPDVERPFELTAVVVDTTPFTSVVITLPLEVSVLLPMTDEVAETPLMVVVRTLPESD